MNGQEGQLSGMRGFLLVWVGQLVSLLGSGMTAFGLTVWAWQETGQATALALVAFFTFAPTVLLSPVAGALVDRSDRRLVMIFSDLGAVLSSVLVLLLFVLGRLEIWHLYITGAIAGAFQAFQFPAYSAAITTMVDKRHFARASGLLSLAGSISAIGAPIVAGFLVGLIGIGGILAIDIVTFFIALFTLLLVVIPTPDTTEEGEAGKGSLWSESLYGFRYILERRSLLLLQLLFTVINLVAMFSFVLLHPMILARSENDTALLGTVLSIGGIGGVLGGLALSTWGGPRRRIHGVLGGIALWAVGVAILGVGQQLVVWAAGFLIAAFFLPILNGANQAIWQAKVAPDVQGRVFAVRRLIAQISAPAAMLVVGPLADFIFEPAMRPGGALAALFGPLVGTGPGAGMGLMFVLSAAVALLVVAAGYLATPVREVERLLPDLVADTPTPPPESTEPIEAAPAPGS